VLPIAGQAAIIVFVDMEIMNARPFLFVRLAAVLCACNVGITTVSASELVLHQVPPLTVEQAPAYPENVARSYYGAQVEAAPQSNSKTLRLNSKSEDANTAEAALLCGDPTVGYALSPGTTTLLVSLSKIENVDSVSCLNRGAKGNMTVAISNSKLPVDSPQWRQVSHQDLNVEAIKTKIGPTEAKYVKLTFDVTHPGRVSSLGIYSSPTVASFTMPRPRQQLVRGRADSFALVSYNLTDVHTRARALYVSSGDDTRQANNMIDDQPATAYSFATNDASPTAVIDLGKTTTLRRISAIYSAQEGSVDFFVLQKLPATQSTKTMRLDDRALNGMKPVGTVANGSGRAAIDFPETTGRYIVMKWTPITQPGASFSVAEVAAFGGNKEDGLLAANTVSANGEQIESDGKTVQEGKDFGDAKDIPAEGAEAPAEGPPPALPPPPPFTFVPELVPTSP
jgi:hypothetical protein